MAERQAALRVLDLRSGQGFIEGCLGQGGLAEVSGRTRLSHDRTEVLHSVDPHRAS
jgi:hypothetical protein